MLSMIMVISYVVLLEIFLLAKSSTAEPISKPYIAFRTDPKDQTGVVHHLLEWEASAVDRRWIHASLNNAQQREARQQQQCPLSLSVGVAKRSHYDLSVITSAIHEPPVLASAFPSHGPGKQVIYNYHEHLDLLTPAFLESSSSPSSSSSFVKEALWQPPDFPLLFEGSTFRTAPLLHDVNADGIMDTIVADYDGGISITGLTATSSSGGSSSKRYFHHVQVPRIYVRREWMECKVDETMKTLGLPPRETPNVIVKEHNSSMNDEIPHDPYHSYFEYYYHDGSHAEKNLVRGETGNIIRQDRDHAQGVAERRRQNNRQNNVATMVVSNEQQQREEIEEMNADAHESRRLQEMLNAHGDIVHLQEHRDGEEQVHHDPDSIVKDDRENERTVDDDLPPPDLSLADDLQIPEEMILNEADPGQDDMMQQPDPSQQEQPLLGEEERSDDKLYEVDDLAYRGYGDDYYGYHQNSAHTEYYDSKHYIRLPPHILTTPILAEVPKMYGNTNDKEDMLLVPISYYLDEDEYEGFFAYKRFQVVDQGDETEVRRGTFVASAIMGYILGESGRWTGQTHLDLSTDFSAPENATIVGGLPVRSDTSRMGAFALSTPAVADLDADGSPEVIVGTSMGMVYAFDARQMYRRDKWPVQLQNPIEHRILVEDVVGDTNLEVFVADIGGNVVCLNNDAQLVWHRDLLSFLKMPQNQLNLPENTDVLASSPMTLGDVNGDGLLDLVQVVHIESETIVFAVKASTGEDLPGFPIVLGGKPALHQGMDSLHQKLPQPLLVDLHTDQSFLNNYLRRNGTHWTQRKPSRKQSPYGGSGPGLHIVQPNGNNLYVIEGYSGCTQEVVIGEDIAAMVQVDDVHGTNLLDLVVATESGNIITLETQAPYHPLNTWSFGEVRGRSNMHAHGYSASQGIFVHATSRQYRDIFGVYVPTTFEIFDNRPNIAHEPERRKYLVEVRDGPSWKRVLWRQEYKEPGVYTENVYIRFGPGYYALSLTMQTSHGIIYEDMFSIAYNVRFLDGLGILLWLPLLIASAAILLCGAKRTNWEDEDFDDGRDGHSLGILGRALPT